MFIDVANTLRLKYSAGRRTMLLIRPDGYLALRHDEWAPDPLIAQLQKWLIRAKPTILEEP